MINVHIYRFSINGCEWVAPRLWRSLKFIRKSILGTAETINFPIPISVPRLRRYNKVISNRRPRIASHYHPVCFISKATARIVFVVAEFESSRKIEVARFSEVQKSISTQNLGLAPKYNMVVEIFQWHHYVSSQILSNMVFSRKFWEREKRQKTHKWSMLFGEISKIFDFVGLTAWVKVAEPESGTQNWGSAILREQGFDFHSKFETISRTVARASSVMAYSCLSSNFM